jgi:hypothetical protein
MMKGINTEYYGDDTRWFVATVIDGSPPRGLEGRVKVRIHGIHSHSTQDIPQKDLPWAQVMMPGDTYGVSGLGTQCHVQAGAMVFGLFLDGKNSQLPFVLGTMPRVEYPTTTQAEKRADPSTNAFSYDFNQSNAETIDPQNETSSVSNVVGFFIDNGLNAKQATAMVAILSAISGLDPSALGGIGGWSGNRYRRFASYIARLSPRRSESDMEGQLHYVMHELHTTHTLAYSKLLRCKEIDGSLYGEKVDGIEEKGNGMIAILRKYYAPKNVELSEEKVSKIANSIKLGAR